LHLGGYRGKLEIDKVKDKIGRSINQCIQIEKTMKDKKLTYAGGFTLYLC
jgi:hypothetical protein